MNVRVKEDSVELEGYVNAVERKSRPLKDRLGQFVERIRAGAFRRAIERNKDIRLLLNHDKNRDLGGTADGNLELNEDRIGLHARATVTDGEVIEKARKGDLVGWSFGFTDVDVDRHDENGIMTRDVNDMDLREVSILDNTRNPAYDGTSVAVRDDEETIFQGEALLTEVCVRDDSDQQRENPADGNKTTPIDYSKWEAMIKEMKGEKA